MSAPQSAHGAHIAHIPKPRTRRVLINSDAKNEADDQYALVHALLSPTLDVRGIIPAHFGTSRSATSMLDSRAEVDLLLDLLGRRGTVTVANGAAHALPDAHTPVDSPGARLILDEVATAGDDGLLIAFLGPLTDMASAILLDPSMVRPGVTVIWIGGPGYGDDVHSFGSWPEFNLRNDIAAANVVFGSGIAIWQVPSTIYRLVNVGYAELRRRVQPHGELGDYLVRQLVEWNAVYHRTPIESRSLGDSPAIGLMLEPWSGVFRRQEPVRFTADGHYEPSSTGSPVLVLESYDVRFLLEDMFAKIADFGEGTDRPTGRGAHD
ncbi:nucleoside hydrolase [Planctomonas psychrotolerans]|uniref:nucleoside hydrolase n=1 Tax=Planctomonas psychrotolerans TaxID=2528712 RepID=UPI001238479C|nr:nucleoside hydrolase [Planctomonas psychrotolerans]